MLPIPSKNNSAPRFRFFRLARTLTVRRNLSIVKCQSVQFTLSELGLLGALFWTPAVRICTRQNVENNSLLSSGDPSRLQRPIRHRVLDLVSTSYMKRK
jgi:hypothetical protein